MSEYTEQIVLPSKALLYEDDIPSEITIKAMSTSEEKLIYGSSDPNSIDEVIRACIVEPKNLDIDQLITADKYFVMIRLRMLTYGDEYQIFYTCPECNHKNPYKINFNELESYELPEDFIEPYEFTLPMSKKEVGIRLLRGKDLKDVDRESKRLLNKFPEMKGDISYTLRMAKYIQTIDGERVEKPFCMEFVESMHGRDSAYFHYKINQIEVGYDITIYRNCKNPRCGIALEFVMPMNVEFFRPRFKD